MPRTNWKKKVSLRWDRGATNRRAEVVAGGGDWVDGNPKREELIADMRFEFGVKPEQGVSYDHLPKSFDEAPEEMQEIVKDTVQYYLDNYPEYKEKNGWRPLEQIYKFYFDNPWALQNMLDNKAEHQADAAIPKDLKAKVNRTYTGRIINEEREKRGFKQH